MSELKNCPFCGDNVLNRYINGIHITESGNFIYCQQCDRAFIYADKSGIKLWNTRPIEDAKDAEVKKLREALEKIELYEVNWAIEPDANVEAIKTIAQEALK